MTLSTKEALGGLDTPLAYRVLLDRYARKDLERQFEIGDPAVVVVKEDPKWPEKGTGRVKSINDDGTITVALDVLGDKMTLPVEQADRPIEHTWSDVAARVAEAIAAVEPADDREHWRKVFYDELVHQRLIPAGRILAGAGVDGLSLYNCVAGETLVHTRQGLRQIKDLSGPVEILTQGGVFRTATFGSYGVQPLLAVELRNGDTLFATANHEWLVRKPKGGLETVRTWQLRGRNVPIQAPVKPVADPVGVAHGIVFGDGTRQHGRSSILLVGKKAELLSFVEPFGGTPHQRSNGVWIGGLPNHFKDLPADNAGPGYWRGFLQGLLATDGYIDPNGLVVLSSTHVEIFDAIRAHAGEAGVVVQGARRGRQVSNLGAGYAPCLQMGVVAQTLVADDFIRSDQRARFLVRSKKPSSVKVVDVRPTSRVEEVFCCNEPETHTMVIGQGYLTKQCHVLPSPPDSRHGIMQTLETMVEIMSRGGGVGFTVSSLRPFRAPVYGVNGRSSGAVSWMDLYSRTTALVEQGGSR